jgi:hypothetical protein
MHVSKETDDYGAEPTRAQVERMLGPVVLEFGTDW